MFYRASGRRAPGLHGPARLLRSPRGRCGVSQAGLWALGGARTRGRSRRNPAILQPLAPRARKQLAKAPGAVCGVPGEPRAARPGLRRSSAGRHRWERPEQAAGEGLHRAAPRPGAFWVVKRRRPSSPVPPRPSGSSVPGPSGGRSPLSAHNSHVLKDGLGAGWLLPLGW